jgi:sugar phosphate isomerase/epimerase
MRIGIDGRKIPEAALRGPIGSVTHARELGVDGVFFRTVLDMTPTLDAGLLAETRAHADSLGMYLESGLGKVNPYASPETPELRQIGDGDIVEGFRRMMTACAAIDCRELWVGTANYKSVYSGRLAYDRFRTDVDWTDQLAATAKFLNRLAPIARDLGIHLNLETHEEITSFELLWLIEQVGDDVIGIVYDTGNPLQRLENPARTVRRIAPYIRQTHIKDAILQPVPGSSDIRYQMRPCGDGVVDFAEILPVIAAANPDVNLSLENDQPRTDPGAKNPDMLIELSHSGFRAAHPDVTDDEVLEHRELVDACAQRIADGEVSDYDTYKAQPFGYAECVRYITDSVEHLREICRTQDLPLQGSAVPQTV